MPQTNSDYKEKMGYNHRGQGRKIDFCIPSKGNFEQKKGTGGSPVP
jgi:hypothetical protein